MSALLSLLKNAVPLLGVFLRGWTAPTALLLYLIANVVLVLLGALTVRMVAPDSETIAGKVKSRRESLQTFFLVAVPFTFGAAVFTAAVLIIRDEYKLDLRELAAGAATMLVIQLLSFAFGLRRARGLTLAECENLLVGVLGRVFLLALAVWLGLLLAFVVSSAFVIPFMLLKTMVDVWSVRPSALKRHLLAAALLLIAVPLHADDPVTWLAENAVRIRSVEPGDDDFHDLAPLKTTLKDVRVVLLGEQSHGDGTTFLAKTRLIRFLHEEMGFDVLAFESGLYDCAKAWELLAGGESAQKAVPRGVFAIWTRSREVQPLIDYLGQRAKSDRPLELAGVDNQLTGSASRDSLAADLAAYLARIDPKLVEGEEWTRVSNVIHHLARSSWELGEAPVPTAKEQAAFAQTIERWRSLIAAHDSTPATKPWSGAFWRQFLASLRAFAEQTWRTDYAKHASNAAVFGMRDRQMGHNLVWLAKERYPKRKIIVWGATFHNARAIGTLQTGDAKLDRLYDGTAPMGEVAWKELGAALYSIGFTSFEGETGTVFSRSAHALPRPAPGSLEDLFARAKLKNAFVDFRHAPPWLRQPQVARLLGHTDMRGDWTRIVDGVIYLHTIKRSRKQ